MWPTRNVKEDVSPTANVTEEVRFNLLMSWMLPANSYNFHLCHNFC